MGTKIETELTMAGVPLRTRFQKIYAVRLSQIEQFHTDVNTFSIRDIGSLFQNNENFIKKIMYFPYINLNYYATGDEVNIEVGKKNCNASGRIIETPLVVKSNGSFKILPYYNNFIDISSTNYKLYLPLYGFVDLPPEKVYNKKVNIWYTLDFTTGDVSISLEIEHSQNDKEYFMNLTSRFGIDIPIGSTNTNQRTREKITTTTRSIAGVVSTAALASAGASTGSASLTAKAVGSGASTLVNASIGYFESNVRSWSSGNPGEGASVCSQPMIPYLIIERPDLVFPTYSTRTIPFTQREVADVDYSEYAQLYGVPCGQKIQLSNMTGYTRIMDVHIENITNATSQEISQIESLLKSGVIL